MKKKAISFALLLAALSAFASTASASPVLTEMGVGVPVGATVQATNVGIPVVTTSLATYNCKQSVLHGNVTANTGTQIEVEISSFSNVDCTSGAAIQSFSAGNLPWCWKTTKTADAFELRGGKCSETAKPVTLFEGSCPVTRTSLTGTFKTSPEDVVMTTSGQEFLAETGFFCPVVKLDVNYTLETAASPFTALFIS